jgi:hypothetical protein
MLTERMHRGAEGQDGDHWQKPPGVHAGEDLDVSRFKFPSSSLYLWQYYPVFLTLFFTLLPAHSDSLLED